MKIKIKDLAAFENNERGKAMAKIADLSNRERIANVIARWDSPSTRLHDAQRFAGYVEALLQNEGVTGVATYVTAYDYQFITEPGLFFGTNTRKETYAELIHRVAVDYLEKTKE